MYKAAESFSAPLAGSITPASTSIALNPSAIAFLTALGIDGTNYTEVAINDGISFEIVRLDQVVGNSVSITRAQANTTASTFPVGTTIRFVWTANGIGEIASQVGASISFTMNVPGAVTGGPAVFNVDVPIYSVGSGLTLTGTYPNFLLDTAAVPPSGDGSVTSVSGSADFSISDPTTTPSISLTTIFPSAVGGNAFGAGLAASGAITGIRVSNTGRLMDVVATSLANGTYANATVEVNNGIITNVFEGVERIPVDTTGTVTIVNAGTGISVTGVPSATPTVGIANTGVVASTYEGVQINAQGQFVAVPAGFGPISSITTTTTGIVIASGGTGIRTINISTGSDTAPGLVQFATNAEATNFAITNRAYDPAKLKLALNSIGSMVKSATTTGSIVGPALVTVAQTLAVGASDGVYVEASLVFSDPTAGADEYNQSYAIGIYANGVAVVGTPAFKSGMKNLSTIIPSFAGGNIELRVTTPTGAQVQQSKLSAFSIADIP